MHSDVNRKNEENAQREIFARRVLSCRKKMGVSQTVLAEKLGVSMRSVQDWEARISVPQPENIHKLCAIFACSTAYLLGMDGGESTAGHTVNDGPISDTARQCREHFEAFMSSCEDQPLRLSWTLVELREHFPLSKWARNPLGSLPDPVPVAGLIDQAAGAALPEPSVRPTSGGTYPPLRRTVSSSNLKPKP